MTVIVLEIPHQFPPKAWVADDWQEAFYQGDHQEPHVSEIDAAELPELTDDPPTPEAYEIAARKGSVVCVYFASGHREWHESRADIDYAGLVAEALNDRHAVYLFETAEQVADFLNGDASHTHHQYGEACLALREAAKTAGFAHGA